MFGIPFTKAGRMMARLNERARAAYLIEEDLALQRELKSNFRLAERSVFLGKDDEALYERVLGTKPPDELHQILTLELLLWMRTRDVLADFLRRDMTPDVYHREAKELRPEIADLYELALLARIAFKRPLRLTEQHQLQAIRTRRT